MRRPVKKIVGAMHGITRGKESKRYPSNLKRADDISYVSSQS